jgi:23S rRNA (guanosine2251-2'-O)-methyltransferase
MSKYLDVFIYRATKIVYFNFLPKHFLFSHAKRGMRKLQNHELNRLSVEEFKQTSKFPLIIVLDNVRSLNNIGSIFRTADALLMEEILLCGFTATPPHRDIHKTALGATDSVAWKYFETTMNGLTYLREKKFKIFAIEQTIGAVSLHDFFPPPGESLAFIFGNEINGVDQEIINQCDGCIEIPQYGTKHSFNIAVSAGIVMWDIVNKTKST